MTDISPEPVRMDLEERERVVDTLGELFKRAADFNTNLVLCALMVMVLRSRLGISSRELMPGLTSVVLETVVQHGFVGDHYIELSDFTETDLAEAYDRAKGIFLDLLKTLDPVAHPHDIVYCTSQMAAVVATAGNVKVESLMSVVGEFSERLEEIFEEAGLFRAEEHFDLLASTYEACLDLMHAAADKGPEGFLAFRDASPYLREPSGLSFRKYVARATLAGKRGPVSGEVVASFNSMGLCKNVQILFSGNEQDVIDLRGVTCDTLAELYGPPTYATEKVAEWGLRTTNGKRRYTVELERGYPGLDLRINLQLKRFW